MVDVMNIVIILFIILYVSLLISYFFSETSGNLKRRSINKIILASMFLAFGIIQYILNYNFFSYHLILLLAIIFAYIGDVVLLYSFIKGGLAFIISNIFFFIYEWMIIGFNKVPFSSIWYFIPLFIFMWGTFACLTLKRFLNFKKKTIPILIYVFSVSLQGTLGLLLAIYFANLKMILLGIGLTLFMISDYFLMTHKFKCHKNWILRCNSGTYFIGLLLVVLSLMY